MTEKPTTVRFAPNLNTAIRQFADDMGISFNAALSVLVAEALTARGRHPSAERPERPQVGPGVSRTTGEA